MRVCGPDPGHVPGGGSWSLRPSFAGCGCFWGFWDTGPAWTSAEGRRLALHPGSGHAGASGRRFAPGAGVSTPCVSSLGTQGRKPWRSIVPPPPPVLPARPRPGQQRPPTARARTPGGSSAGRVLFGAELASAEPGPGAAWPTPTRALVGPAAGLTMAGPPQSDQCLHEPLVGSLLGFPLNPTENPC